MNKYLESLWCALYCSENFYSSWLNFKDWPRVLPESAHLRGMALKHKAMAMVEFDRILNDYNLIDNLSVLINRGKK